MHVAVAVGGWVYEVQNSRVDSCIVVFHARESISFLGLCQEEFQGKLGGGIFGLVQVLVTAPGTGNVEPLLPDASGLECPVYDAPDGALRDAQ